MNKQLGGKENLEGLNPKDLSAIRPLMPQNQQGQQWYAFRTGKQGETVLPTLEPCMLNMCTVFDNGWVNH